MSQYKRIISIRPEDASDLQAHSVGKIFIRPARSGDANEWVIEGFERDKRHIDRLVQLFDTARAS